MGRTYYNEDCIARGGKCVDTKIDDCDFFYKGDYAERMCKELVFKCCLPKHTVACHDLNGWCKFSCDDSEQPFGENVCYGKEIACCVPKREESIWRIYFEIISCTFVICTAPLIIYFVRSKT